MAQQIKHRRGSISSVRNISSFGEAEIIIGSGSVDNKVSGPIVYIGKPGGSTAANDYAPISKMYVGSGLPSVTTAEYGATLDGLPYYDTSNKKLYILGAHSDGTSGHSEIIITKDSISNFDTVVSASVAASGFGSGGTADFNELTNVPAGLVSSSAQISITESQISNLTHYTDSDVKAKLDTENVISASAQISITESQISDLTHYTDSDVLNYIDGLGVVSGSTQISYLNISDVPSGIVSSSTQIEAVITDSYISASVAASGFGGGGGTSDFTQLTNVPAGLVSSSAQISITESQISDLTHYTDSDVKSKLDTENVISSSLQIVGGLVGKDIVVKSLTAEQYIVSSSITHMTTSFSSGSTIFGDTVDDTHQMTGSLYVSGDIFFNEIDGGTF
jgi:hypothetical protein